ncbi:hypothetical protein LZ30DRAFT_731089 [Colletotrichum cereale]|nr:hypothetical protein LZ30DRAFT_731089 [Colletotrichum cereale]
MSPLGGQVPGPSPSQGYLSHNPHRVPGSPLSSYYVNLVEPIFPFFLFHPPPGPLSSSLLTEDAQFSLNPEIHLFPARPPPNEQDAAVRSISRSSANLRIPFATFLLPFISLAPLDCEQSCLASVVYLAREVQIRCTRVMLAPPPRPPVVGL